MAFKDKHFIYKYEALTAMKLPLEEVSTHLPAVIPNFKDGRLPADPASSI